MTELSSVEVTRAEAALLVRLVRASLADVERMLRNVEETEGFDATKHRLRRELTAEVDVATDLLVKLEAAAAELSKRR